MAMAASSASEKRPTFYVPPDFFKLKERGETSGSWMYTCQKCFKKTISTSYKSRINLRAHVKCKHSHSLSKFDTACKAADGRKKCSSTQPIQSLVKPPTISFDRKLTETDLDKCVVEYLSECVLPFHHVESEGFQTFVRTLSPHLKLKTEKTYRRMTSESHERMREALKIKLAVTKKVCLTVDHWSSYRKGYIGVTAHWVSCCSDTDTMDLSANHACLALHRIRGRCTHDVLGREIQGIIDEYGLSRKVSHCVTDSGSNFMKAFEQYSVSDDVLAVDDAPECNAVNPEEISDVLETAVSCKEYSLPPHFKCSAHRLNLLATKDIEDAMKSPRLKEVYRSLMGKLSALWNKQSRSALASDAIKDHLGRLLVTPNATRWNSTFDSLNRVQEFIECKESSLQSLLVKFEIRPITVQEKDFLREFLSTMRPVAAALDILQGDDVSAGYLLPTLLTLQKDWEALLNVGMNFCCALVQALQHGLNRRFSKELNSPFFKVASSLHSS